MNNELKGLKIVLSPFSILASFLSKSSKSSENEKYADKFVFLAKEYNRAKRSLIELREL